MTTTIRSRPTPTNALAPVEGRSSTGRTGLALRLLPLGMAATVAVDLVLGESAEYFNAASLLRAIGSAARGRGTGGHTFLVGQEHLGDGPAILLGTLAWVVEPAIVLLVIVHGLSALRQAISQRNGA